jgi:hypothetical protein
MRDYGNAMVHAEEARRLSEQIERDDSIHLPTALIIRAALGMNDLTRAEMEFQQLTAHMVELGADVRIELALISEELMHRVDDRHLAIICLDLLLQLQLRAPQTASTPAAVSQPFSNVMLLMHLIHISKEQYDRLKTEVEKTKQLGNLLHVGQQEERKTSDASTVPMDVSTDGESIQREVDEVTVMASKLADYFEQLLEVQTLETEIESSQLTEKEIIWSAPAHA